MTIKTKYKKDKRERLWAKLELEIQNRVNKKDKKFILSGKWKKFMRKQKGFKIYAVNGEWIRNNLSVIFSHGGHGLVHEFIPKDEIWVSTHHFNESKFNKCRCGTNKKQKVSKQFFESTIIHEIAEFKEMKKGMLYWKAHQIALEKEKNRSVKISV